MKFRQLSIGPSSYGRNGAAYLFAVLLPQHNETLSVIAVCISNGDRLSVGINRCDAAPTPTGFAEIVSDDFPELHVEADCAAFALHRAMTK
jgi:hypothetical protein